ncbi:MAG TPA: prolyl oligopeptidase family serine peptidase [Ilumatobacteraceae bacterium]|nr:prolyl oligopeptidase family serine peptidase [Ilumatobacteraceae bacterium]
MSIPVERCIVSRDLTEPRLSPDGRCLVYAMNAGGSAALMIDTLDGAPVRQLTAYPAPRPGRGFGGGCWCWNPDGSSVVYAGVDGNLWSQPVPAGPVRQLTQHGPERSATAPVVCVDRGEVVYVIDDAEVWSTRIGDGSSRRLDDGSADFVFDPCPAPDGSAVWWQAWSVPDMPWDASRIQRFVFDRASVEEERPAHAIQQIRFLPDGTVTCLRDDSGWLNLWLGGKPLVDEAFEHGGPAWGMGQRSYAMSPNADRIAFTRNERGFGRLCVVDVDSRVVTEVARGVHGQLSWQGGRLAALRSGARTPTQVVVYDDATWERNVVAIGPLSGWEDLPLAEPDLVEIATSDGSAVHARLYCADSPTDHLLCWLHGGPTDQWQVTFMPRIAYWRSRGWNVLVPDHRGSTGHGRLYQQAMRGRWGELDVSDTIDSISHAHAQGWGAPQRTAIIGSSAGGFTALGVAATRPDLAAAAIVAYPVTDLSDLAERSHRFERHYTDSLVGPLPAAQPLYDVRSPSHFAPRLAATPLLVMHGDSDPVVPVEQSAKFVERCLEAGGSVEFVVYEGEGHGFRKPENQLDEYRRMQTFLATHVLGG